MVIISRPRDRSLQAYKDWIRGVTAHLGGVDNLTDTQYEQKWQAFWAEADKGLNAEARQGWSLRPPR